MMYRIYKSVSMCLLTLLTLIFWSLALYAQEIVSIQSACANAPDKIQCEMQFIAEHSEFVVLIFSDKGDDKGGIGTGFLFKDRGGFGILTNNHVIKGGRKTWIKFSGTEIAQPVEVVGRDQDLDVALLSVPQGGIPRGVMPAKLGRSDTLQYGDRVYTAGYPLGNESVTTGHVNSLTSAIGHHYFSTQAPVHQGNSGGPLFRISNSGELEVIGINTAIKESGLLTWSLHIDYVVRTIPKLRTEKVVSHAKAGMSLANIADLPPPMYEKLTGTIYPPKRSGIIVVQVEDGSPAAVAGVQGGDIITEVRYEGNVILSKTAEQLFDLMFFDLIPGSKVVFVTNRGTDIFNREVTLGGKKDIPVNVQSSDEYPGWNP